MAVISTTPPDRQRPQQVHMVKKYRPHVLLNALKVDTLSVGIFDASEVVLDLTMDGNRSTAHTFDQADTVGSFRDWYRTLWYAAEPLDTFVGRLQGSRGVAGGHAALGTAETNTPQPPTTAT